MKRETPPFDEDDYEDYDEDYDEDFDFSAGDPSSGEKYTGEIIIKIRPVRDEEADVEKLRAREKAELATPQAMADEEGVSF